MIGVLCCVVLLPTAVILLLRLEGEKPAVELPLSSPMIGTSQTISMSVSDEKSGLRRVWIALLQEGKEVVLFDERFPGAGMFKGGKISKQPSLKIKIEPRTKGLNDGKAVLRVTAWDYSWRSWGHGNKTDLAKEITIDTRPPEIEVLSKFHNINQGGAGLVIYKISEPCGQSGAFVGDFFYPGRSGYYSDANILLAFFALDYAQSPDTKIYVEAVDLAGNRVKAGFYSHIRKKRFKKDIVSISDEFLNQKMPEFEVDLPPTIGASLVEKFLKVNRELRKTSADKIIELTSKSDTEMYWDGPFLRLPRSSRQAGFADHREYQHNGRTIDHQVHLGVDLASVRQSPIPAANRGKVIFTGRIGIYGKTVIIDHGFGLFSLYSHLSGFEARKGQIVSKGEVLGHTGDTGLAGGDHLHFSMVVNSTFVNPIEWWDADWIKNNITDKMNAVTGDAKKMEKAGS